jgi:aerobic carbon-monoxide dehydrogenase medium subunit
MKPAAFDYHAPRSVDEAVELLAAHGDDAKVLAGGQSLVPAMNFRLARPAVLVDINRIAELDFCIASDGALRIGALTRHVRFERPVTDGPLGPLLADVVRYVAHLPIRVRGTFTGSLAHADPAAEWCVVATTLDAEIRARGPDGERSIPAAAFFRSILTTSLRPDELITEVRLPALGPDWRFGFAEFSRRAGDFALSMALAALRVDGGRIAEARIGVGGAGDRPLRISEAEQALQGTVPGPEALAEAGAIAAAAVDPFEDLHASVAYRRDLVRVMTKRALERALAP